MWYRSNFFKYSAGILAVLLIIRLSSELQFLLRPLGKALTALFTPMLAAGFLYYLFRPLVEWLERVKVPKVVAIIGIYLLLFGLLTGMVVYGGIKAGRELSQLGAVLSNLIAEVRAQGVHLIQGQNFGAILTGKIHQQAIMVLQKAVPFLTGGILAIGSTLAELAPLLLLVPFILFYFLNEDQEFATRWLPKIAGKYRGAAKLTLNSIDRVLAAYISGQAVLAIGQGSLMYIGFLILGVPYSLVLAAVILIASFIPVFGLLLGSLPALAVGVASGSWLVGKILFLLVLVNLLRKLAAPQLIGKKLKIHPLTVIVILLIAGAVWGFSGILIAVPVYAVVKEIVKGIIGAREKV